MCRSQRAMIWICLSLQHATRCEPNQRFSVTLRDLRASERRGQVLAAGLEGRGEDRKRGLRIGTSAGEDIESEKSVLGLSVERDVRLREVFDLHHVIPAFNETGLEPSVSDRTTHFCRLPARVDEHLGTKFEVCHFPINVPHPERIVKKPVARILTLPLIS
jgi:hypothetical protein